MIRILTAVLLCLAPMGCATTSQVRSGFVELDEAGSTTLGTHEGGTVRLLGPNAEELAVIAGANVKVEGVTLGGGFKVRRYQILDVGTGFFAYVGWVVVDQSGCWLREWRTGRDWEIVGVDMEEFKLQHGAKIWVSGLEEGPRRIRPLQWGVLRPAMDSGG